MAMTPFGRLMLAVALTGCAQSVTAQGEFRSTVPTQRIDYWQQR